MSQVQVFNNGGSTPPPPDLNNVQVVLPGPVVNILNPGPVSLFTTENKIFIPMGVVFYGSDIQGPPAGDGSYNMGWTAPDYNDLLDFSPMPVMQTGLFGAYGGGQFSYNPIPPNTEVFLNVTTPDSTATTYEVKIDILGYYLN